MYGVTGEWLWIDDKRPAPEPFRHCRNYKEAIASINYFSTCEGGIDFISFDHDLGGKKSGYDIAKYLVENHIPVQCYAVHSSNPVGRFNIEQLLDHYGYKKLGQG